MLPGRTGARAAAYSSSQMTRSIRPAPRPPYSSRPRDADPARLVHLLLPRAAALERLAVAGHAVVGRIVQAQLGREVDREPLAELLAERLVLGTELEVHGRDLALARPPPSRIGSGALAAPTASGGRATQRRMRVVEPLRFLHRRGERGQVSHLAARAGLDLAVEMQLDLRRSGRPPPSPARRRSTGRRADWPWPRDAAAPSTPAGSPHTARSCCSNWLVTEASKVRWPELCGRGASSLTSSRPSRVRKELHAEDADHVQLLQQRARQANGVPAHALVDPGGRDRHVEDVLGDAGSRSAPSRRRPRRGLARPPRRSRARNPRRPRESPAARPRCRHASSASAGEAMRTAPCRHSRTPPSSARRDSPAARAQRGDRRASRPARTA